MIDDYDVRLWFIIYDLRLMIIIYDYSVWLWFTTYDLWFTMSMGCPWEAVDIHENRWTRMDICIHGYLLCTLVCLLVRWLPPTPLVHWCGGPMMCVLFLPGGHTGSWPSSIKVGGRVLIFCISLSFHIHFGASVGKALLIRNWGFLAGLV